MVRLNNFKNIGNSFDNHYINRSNSLRTAGEYVTVSSQTDIEKADIERKKLELQDTLELELQRLTEICKKEV